MPIARYVTWGARVPQALWAVALAVACAVVIVVAARSTPSGGQSQATGATPSMLRGIPQNGITLGRLGAPATLTAYVDPAFMSGELSDPATLRRLLDADVRPGRLKIQLRTVPSYDVPSLTDQGVPGARTLQAAGLQNHLWDLLLVLSGPDVYVDFQQDDQLREAAGRVPGLDVAQMLSDRASARITQAIARATSYATAAGITTPAYVLTRPDGSTVRLHGSLAPAVDEALASR